MKINVNQISPEGLSLEEDIPAQELDLDTDLVKFRQGIKVKAQISRITNAVTVDLFFSGTAAIECGRCLQDYRQDFQKKIRLNYQVTSFDQEIDLGPDIREEIILDYPLKPLCQSACKGLCPGCGENLNEGGCSCGSTEKKAF